MDKSQYTGKRKLYMEIGEVFFGQQLLTTGNTYNGKTG